MRDNDQKITPDVVRDTRLVFYPKTREEALFIQQQLLAMGARWAGGGRSPENIGESVEKGLLSERGTLYYNPTEDSGNRLASVEQLDPDYLPPEQRFLKEQFDKVNARLDAMEKRIDAVTQKVDHMHDEMFPTIENTKPKLSKGPTQ